MNPLMYIGPRRNNHNANYIPSTAKQLKDLTTTQRKLAKKAIKWLLTKGSYTNNEIAEHFGLSIELVDVLVKKNNYSNQTSNKQFRREIHPLGYLSSQTTVK